MTRPSTGSSLASAVLPAISFALPRPSTPSSQNERKSADLTPSSSVGDKEDANPQLQYQNHHHQSHLPFTIGPLRSDGTEGTHGDDGGHSHHKGRHRSRKREKLAKAGRSLSPFRSFHGRSTSLTRLSEALSAVRFYHHGDANKLLSPPKARGSGRGSSDVSPSDDGHDTESETDTDSIKKGLCPRNTAFGRGGRSDGEDDDGASAYSDYDEDHPNRISGDEGDSEHRRTTDNSSSTDESGGEDEHGAADDEDEDSLVDFDDATIDNTLFNAGCLDLHNAWQNNKESIGEGGWYPSDDDPSWHQQGNETAGASSSSSHQHQGQTADEPEEYFDGARTTSLDATTPPSEQTDLHDRLPNVILPSSHRPTVPKRQGSKWVSAAKGDEYSLVASRPIFAKNRCTITLTHGEYEQALKKRKEQGGRGPKKWIVCSDGSEESSYAIEWTIGTVLRDGDETLVVSVMETSEKLDPTHLSESAMGSAFHKENQNIRQSMALVLARQATALLQRTRLAVKITCQALHAKHSRHMLLDLIDFFEPTMVIVGSRGLGSLKGILLGSTSHYLVQKSSRPIMIARKRLQLPALPRGKGDVVSSVRRRHMRLDEAAIEKKSKVGEEDDGERDGERDNDSHTDGEHEGGRKSHDEGEGGGEKMDDSKEEAEVNANESEVDATVTNASAKASKGPVDGDAATSSSSSSSSSSGSAGSKQLNSSGDAVGDNDDDSRGRRRGSRQDNAADEEEEEEERGRSRSRAR